MMHTELADRLSPQLCAPWLLLLSVWFPFLLLAAMDALPLVADASPTVRLSDIASSPSDSQPAFPPSTTTDFSNSNASSAPPPTSGSAPSNGSTPDNGLAVTPEKNYRGMTVFITVVFVVILIFGFCVHYVTLRPCCFCRARNREAEAAGQWLEEDGSTGLNPWEVRSLPTVRYTGGVQVKVTEAEEAAGEEGRSEKKKKKAMEAVEQECTVCLSEFEEGEELKLLPDCGHAFHIVCIDMWLFSHTTCPICRVSVLTNSGTYKPAGDPQPRGIQTAVPRGPNNNLYNNRWPDPLLLTTSTSSALQMMPPPSTPWHAQVDDDPLDEPRESSATTESSARNSSVALYPHFPSA